MTTYVAKKSWLFNSCMIDCFLYVDVPEWWALHLFSWEVSGIEEKKQIFSPEKMELISIGSWDPENEWIDPNLIAIDTAPKFPTTAPV